MFSKLINKIKKEHIFLIVLVIVVLLLIFINLKNKRGLRERFYYPVTYPPTYPDTNPVTYPPTYPPYQDNYYQIVFSTIGETRKLSKIGIIGINEELFFKLFDCEKKNTPLIFKGKRDMSDMGEKYISTTNDNSDLKILYHNPANPANHVNNMNYINNIDIIYTKELKQENYNLKELMHSDYDTWQKLNINWINISKKVLIGLFNDFYIKNKNEDIYTCKTTEAPSVAPHEALASEEVASAVATAEAPSVAPHEALASEEVASAVASAVASVEASAVASEASATEAVEAAEASEASTTEAVEAAEASAASAVVAAEAAEVAAAEAVEAVVASAVEVTSVAADVAGGIERTLLTKRQTDSFIGNIVVENFYSQNNQAKCKEATRLETIKKSLQNQLISFYDTNKASIDFINADSNFKQYINTRLNKSPNFYKVTDYFVENTVDITPIHQQYAGLRIYKDTNNKQIEIDIFKLEDNMFEETKNKFDSMYLNKVKPIWYQLFLKDRGFPKCTNTDSLCPGPTCTDSLCPGPTCTDSTCNDIDLSTFHENVKNLNTIYITLLNSLADVTLNYYDCINICPGPSPECSDNTTLPVKFRITNFNSLGLTNKIETEMKKIVGTEITFTYEEVEFYFTITINGKNIDHHLQIKEKREHIKNVMTDIYYKHLQDLYKSSKNEMYNIPKERIKVFVLHGSLKIVLEILSEEYAHGPSETPKKEQDLSDMEEWKQFMSTFNMPGGTENIVQYEPEGVSGIFAPYIKIV
jgi:hypothetical protein